MNHRSFLLAAMCTIVQYYDYHLFGFLAAKISKTFSYSADNVVQLTNTYLVMALAVAAKPVGALLLGRLGDIYGRFTTIILSLSGTAIASLIIALTPGYSSIGIYAAFILLFARMIVSGLVSSGTDGVRIFIYERIGKKRQCLGNGLVTSSSQIGSLLASISAWLFTLDFLPDYSWRFAFIIGSIMGAVVIVIRIKFPILNDDLSTVSTDMEEYNTYKNTNTISIVIKNYKLFIVSAILAGCIGSSYQFIIIFFGTYNFEILKIVKPDKMFFYTSLGITIYMIFSIIGGMFADNFGRRESAIIGGLTVIILSLFLSFMIANNYFSSTLYLLINAALPFITMPALAFLKDSIPAVIRYRIFSLAHAVGSILISAPTAYISTKFYSISGQSWMPMTYFITTIILMIIVVNILYYVNKIKNSGINTNNTTY